MHIKPHANGTRIDSWPRRQRIASAVALGLLALALSVAWAIRSNAQQVLPGQPVQMRSFSGQFVVSAARAEPPRTRQVLNLETNRDYVHLDPTLLPVSCERIKQNLARQLGLTAPWRGRIYVSLYPASSGDDQVTISPAHFTDGWRYRVDLPSFVNRWDFVRAIVQVLLLEVANRGAADHSAEIPSWLVEGLSQQLLLSRDMEIILPPPGNSADGLRLATRVVDARKPNPLEEAHRLLRSNPPLTFQQLSWPANEQLDGEQAPLYRSNAQLFVHDLLALEDGPACMRSMLAYLPLYYNWQFAFLRAYRSHFQRPLDIEKWWALHFEHFTGRELAQNWRVDESWQKLEESLHIPVQVRAGSNELPMEVEVSLQTIIQEWDKERQTLALQQKLRELEGLRLRLATNYVELTEQYHQVISTFLQNRDRRGLIPFRKKAVQRSATAEAVRDLNELDSRRMDLK